MKVLVDTNVVLDVLLNREHFCRDSTVILYLAKGAVISAFFPSFSMTNVFYILRRRGKSLDEAYQEMDKLNIIFTVAPVTENTIASALALRWKDFEDAVQFITAKESKLDFIITRNKADYESSDISCMSPTEFIAYLEQKEESEKNE